MSFFKNKYGVILTALFCCFLWGSAAPFIKMGYSLFEIKASDTASILVFAGLRFALAGILVLIFGSLLQKKVLFPVKESAKAIGILALCQTMGQYFFYYVGLAHTSGVNGAIITGTGAFISLLVASLVFKFEVLTINKVIGCVLGFLGILLMNINGSAIVCVSWFGDIFVLLSQFFCSFSAAFIKKYTQRFNPVYLSGYQFLLGGSLLALTGVCMSGSISFGNIQGMFVLVYLALVSACAYTLWGILLSLHDVSKIGIYNCLIPIVGVCLSSIFLKEEAFSMHVLFSLIFVSLGIYFVSMKKVKL